MKLLGFEPKDIHIFSREDILKKGKEVFDKKGDLKGYDKISATETYNKLLKEPVPYCLFRLNELRGYDLSYIGCEISEEQYMERLECLPPVPFKTDIYSGYIIPECVTGNIYEHIFEQEGKYYCVLMPCQNNKLMQGWF